MSEIIEKLLSDRDRKFNATELDALSAYFREMMFTVLHERGTGHWGGASSAAELVTSLYRKTAVKLPPFKVEDVRLKNEYLNCYKSL